MKILGSFVRKIAKVLVQSFQDFLKHDGVEHAGYLSFVFMLAIFPATILLSGFLSFLANMLSLGPFFHQNIDLLIANAPPKAMDAIIPRIKEILSGPSPRLVTFAAVGMLWTASSAVEGIRTVLNRANRIEKVPHYIRRRLLSIVQFMIIVIGGASFVLIATYLPFLLGWLKVGGIVRGYTVLFFFAVSYAFCAYVFVPNTHVRITYVLPGVLLFAFFTCVAVFSLASYVRAFNPIMSGVYGGMTSIIIAMLFFYFENIIFIYCAELNYRIHVLR